MELNEIIDAVYKELSGVNKIVPFVFSAFLVVAFVLKQVLAYRYSKNYQKAFGIPHYRFSGSINKSIVEIAGYVVMLLLFIVSQYVFIINYFKIGTIVCAICCSVFVVGYNFIVFSPLIEKLSLKIIWIITIIISVIVLVAIIIGLIYFPLTKGNYDTVECILILYSIIVLVLYSIYLIASFLYSIYRYFSENANPVSGEYEVITIDKDMYAIVPCIDKEMVLIKLKKVGKKLYIVKSDYIIMNSINSKNIKYLNVELEEHKIRIPLFNK